MSEPTLPEATQAISSEVFHMRKKPFLSLGFLRTNHVLFYHCKRRNKVPPVSLGSSEPHKFCTEERAWEHSVREGGKCDVL